MVSGAGEPLAALGALVLPARCGGCGRLGRAWCGRCASEVAARTLGAYRVLSPACAEADVPVWAYVPYEGPMRSAIGAYKDGDRRDLREVLAPMLRASVAAALRGWADVPVLVPVPSSRASVRRRGDWPLLDLVRAACPGGEPVPALVQARRVADQAGLTARGRRANLRGAFALRPEAGRVVRGSSCLLLDDVVTTGSSLAEAARALRAAGAREVRAAVVCASELPALAARAQCD